MRRNKQFLLAAFLGLALFAANGSPHAAAPEVAADNPEIAGLRLGMNPDEVLAVLQAHRPRLEIRQVNMQLTARDARRRNVPVGEFLGEINATRLPNHARGERDPMLYFNIVFPGPPAEPRAIFIAHMLEHPQGHGPALDEVAGAIEERHGEPRFKENDGRVYRALWRAAEPAVSTGELQRYANQAGSRAQGLNSAMGGRLHNVLPIKLGGADRTPPGPHLGYQVGTAQGTVVRIAAYLGDDPARIERMKADTAAHGTGGPAQQAREETAQDSPAAGAARQIDALGALWSYHKLAGTTPDFQEMAKRLRRVQQAGDFDRDSILAAEAADLQAAFEAFDHGGLFTVNVQTRLDYLEDREQVAIQFFEPGRVLPFDPFVQRIDGREHRLSMFAHFGELYQRRLAITNREAARYLPLPRDQARVFATPQGWAPQGAIMELTFRLTGAVPGSGAASGSMLLAQLETIRLAPGGQWAQTRQAQAQTWPFGDAITVGSGGEFVRSVDDMLVLHAYHKLRDEPIDFAALAGATRYVRAVEFFDQDVVQRAEAARLQAAFEAVDPRGTYAMNVTARLEYELDRERFRVSIFAPDSALTFQPLRSMSLEPAHVRSLPRNLHMNYLVQFTNADALRYVAVPRDRAARIDGVAQRGFVQGPAELVVRFVGTGDPLPGNRGGNVLRAEVISVSYAPIGLY
ncbi:MAG: hypothetical protein EA371_13480 [Gammaproteobacteria bacterium]|nr:MAG: hypothetical protein EA371_13480 [Gammaproteobacteria bacterium]